MQHERDAAGGELGMEERYHIPLVLCCAEENEVSLVRVLDELHREGRAPEVVAGVDLDPELLTRAVDRTDGPALFVLCQSDELDRAATRRLAGLFSARKAPEHRIVTVQLTPSRPLSVLPPIRTALKELMRAQYEREQERERGGDREFMRDVVGPTPVTAVDRKGPDPEEMARRLHREMLAAEALLDRRSRGKPGGTARKEATVRDEARRGRGVATAAAAARRPEAQAAYAGEPGAPQVAMEDEEAGMPSLLPALERVPEVSIRSSPETVQTDFTPTENKVRRRSPPADPAPRSVAGAVEERPGSRVLLFVAIAGITALALMAVLHMSGEDGQGEKGSATQRRGADVDKAEARANAKASAKAAAAGEGGAAAAEGGAAAGEGGAAAAEGGAAAAEGGAAAAEGGAAAGEGGADVDEEHEEDAAEGGAGPRPLVPPPPPSDSEALVIDQAIADGKIRSLDTLLVLKPNADPMTWTEANDVCRSRSVSSIRGWHLPSTGEVKRLRRSRMLGATIYWTRSRNTAKDEAFALDARSGRVNLYLTVERVARPICVRER